MATFKMVHSPHVVREEGSMEFVLWFISRSMGEGGKAAGDPSDMGQFY